MREFSNASLLPVRGDCRCGAAILDEEVGIDAVASEEGEAAVTRQGDLVELVEHEMTVEDLVDDRARPPPGTIHHLRQWALAEQLGLLVARREGAEHASLCAAIKTRRVSARNALKRHCSQLDFHIGIFSIASKFLPEKILFDQFKVLRQAVTETTHVHLIQSQI